MTIPFRRSPHDRSQDPGGPSNEQLIARLRAMDVISAHDATEVATARGRVWQRLVTEHPTLATRPPANRPHRPNAIATGIADGTGSNRRSLVPTGRRAQGGWRAAFDVAAVAVLIVGLVLSARGVGLMPNGGNPNPMTTQSVAASTPTRVAVSDGAGTNRQPGPPPLNTPAMQPRMDSSRRIQGDLILGAGVVYGLTSPTADSFSVVGYDPATLEEVWSRQYMGVPVDLAVSDVTVSVVTLQADGRGTLINETAIGDGETWSLDLPFRPLGVTSSADVILVSSHDESTATPNTGQPGDISRLLAVNTANGAVRWDIELTNPAGVEPLLTHDGIYYTTANGTAKAIETESGATRWTTGTGGLRITSDPVAGNGLVYVVRPDGVVLALDQVTGNERWGQGVRTQDLGVPPLVTTVGETSTPVPEPVLALSAGRQLLVGYVWADGDLRDFAASGIPVEPDELRLEVVAFDAANGDRLWSQSGGLPVEPVTGNLELGVTVAANQVLIHGARQIMSFRTDTGERVWDVPVEGRITGRLIVVDRSVLLTTNVRLGALREPAIAATSTATPDATPNATPDTTPVS